MSTTITQSASRQQPGTDARASKQSMSRSSAPKTQRSNESRPGIRTPKMAAARPPPMPKVAAPENRKIAFATCRARPFSAATGWTRSLRWVYSLESYPVGLPFLRRKGSDYEVISKCVRTAFPGWLPASASRVMQSKIWGWGALPGTCVVACLFNTV